MKSFQFAMYWLGSIFLLPMIVYGQDYTLVKRDGRISMYEKWIAVTGNDKVREIKFAFSLRAGVDDVIGLLANQEKAKQWNNTVSEYRILNADVGNTSWVSYIRYDIPWPMKDQDCCLQYKVARSDGRAEIWFNSIQNKQFPVTGDVNRITGTKGKWLMQDMGNGNLSIVYTVSTDRNTSIPQWVSDPIIQKQFFKSFTSFISLIEKKEA